MQIGLVGLSQSGKTTLFQLLTGFKGSQPAGKSNKAVVKVPDARIDYLSGVFKPKKTTFATLEAVDIPGLIPGADKSAVSFLQAVRESDILIHVIQNFNNPDVPHIYGDLDPMRDLEAVSYELLLADLDQIEKRLDKIKEGKQKNVNPTEVALLEKLKAVLEDERPITSVDLSDDEEIFVRNYQFLTAKPYIVVVNVDENALLDQDYPQAEEIIKYCQERNTPLQFLSAKIENEISELEGEERDMFLEELGIKETGISVLTRLVYEKLGLISFFTVGEDEVRAWTIEKDTIARKAAGKIHSDIERGFIRAEVIAYSDFLKAGSMAAARTEGTLRLEGKEYIVKDGDIAHFRFNV